MKILLLNLPNREKLIRRARCSYRAFGFCYPPIELLSLGAILKKKKGVDLNFLDAIAENKPEKEVLQFLTTNNFDLIVTILGFEHIDQDILLLNSIKEKCSRSTIVAMGYLPSIMPEKVLQLSKIDIILMQEPEISLSELYDKMEERQGYEKVKGVAYSLNDIIQINPKRDRIKNLDDIPFPEQDLIKSFSLYSEPFAPKPFTCLETSRGCRHHCVFCVRPYGEGITFRSPNAVLNEIEHLYYEGGIRCIRFTDDDFFASRERIIHIAEGLIQRNLSISWIALARVDSIDEELCRLIKKSGCIRLDMGIESGSDHMLKYLKKGYSSKAIAKQIDMIKSFGIEISAKFLIDSKDTSNVDFNQTLALIKKLPFDFVEAMTIQYYPGTELYEMNKKNVFFQLIPYENTFRPGNSADSLKRERIFFMKYYLSFKFLKKFFILLLRYPKDLFFISMEMFSYLFIPALLKTKRKDFS